MSIVLLVYLASVVGDIKSLGGLAMFFTPVVFLVYLWIISYDNICKKQEEKSKVKYVKNNGYNILCRNVFICIHTN